TRVRAGGMQAHFCAGLAVERVIGPHSGRPFAYDYPGAENHGKNFIPIGQAQCRNWLVEKPCAYPLIRKRAAMDQKAVDVGPVNGLVRCMPNCTFSAHIACWRNTNRILAHWTLMPTEGRRFRRPSFC